MRKPVRLVLWIAGVTGAVLLVVFLVSLWVVRRPFPDVRGSLALAGLDAPVEVLRDEYGVPHIWASTKHDLYFAQGFVHAQDRFWQMEFSRRIGAGRLSELLGTSAVDMDRFLRTVGFREVAERELELLEAPHRTHLESYAAGVNAYIADRSPSRLGLEFTLLRLTGVTPTIEPWTPIDSLTWGKVMAYNLGANLSNELQNIALRRYGGLNLANALRPPFRDEFPYIVTMAEVRDFRRQLGLEPLPAGDARQTYRVANRGVGSNNWVIAGSRTQSGLPLLANDMHLAVQMPSIWYEVGLHLRASADAGGDQSADDDIGRGVRGYSFPGVPGVIAGQNDRIAWGLTNVGGDVQDTHAVELHPDDPDRYRLNGRWEEMEVRRELIHVAGEQLPAEHEVRRTAYGPVITDLPQYEQWFGYRVVPDEDAQRVAVTELALEWTALRPERLLTAVLDLNWARNYEEFRSALTSWESPGQNIVYADRDGTIAYQTTGAYPARDVRQGQLPMADRSGPAPRVPFDELPAALNPEKGYIVTANQPVVPPEYPHELGMDFASGRRASRIEALIRDSETPLDVRSVAEMHADVYSRAGVELFQAVGEVAADEALASWRRYRDSRRPEGRAAGEQPAAGQPAAARTPAVAEREREEERADELLQDLLPAAYELMAEWDGRLTPESAAGLLYGYVQSELMHQVFADEVPPEALPVAVAWVGQSAVHALLENPDNELWDDRFTEREEPPREIVGRALSEAVLAAAADHGEDPTRWRWGDAHRVSFESQSLGQSGIGIVERILNRGPYPMAGGPSTVNVAHWRVDELFTVSVTASQRAIYDLADPARSRFMHTTGQSGHPFHRHYDDMIRPWREVEYHPSNWRYEDARESAGRRRLMLQPGG